MGVMTWVWPGPLRVSEVKGRNTCNEGGFFSEDSLLFGFPGEFLHTPFCQKFKCLINEEADRKKMVSVIVKYA